MKSHEKYSNPPSINRPETLVKKESIEKFVQGANNSSGLNPQQSNSSLGAVKSPRDVKN
jgi:hypothetical protein